MSTAEAKRFRRVMKLAGPKTRKRRVSQTVKKYVRKELNKGTEINVKEKVAFGTGSGTNYENHQYSGIPANSTELMRIIPTVEQGDERDERDGAKIKLQNVSGTFFCHIPGAYAPTAGAAKSAASGIQCRLLILSCKQVQAVGQFEQNWAAGQNFNRQFLKNGSQATGFNGDLFSLRWPVNTQLFTKHYDKYFTLKRGFYLGDNTSGAAMQPEVSCIKRFRIKCRNKQLQFNEPGTSEHTNWSLFGVLLYANSDSSLTNSSPGPVYGNMYSRITWKDM